MLGGLKQKQDIQMPEHQSNTSESLNDTDSRPWIQAIHINKVRHLEDIDINVCDDTAPRHLMVTGPNGSGKTSLLLEMRTLLERLSSERDSFASQYPPRLEQAWKNLRQVQQQGDHQAIQKETNAYKECEQDYHSWLGEVALLMHCASSLPARIQNKEFVIAYYPDNRKSSFVTVQTPTKPRFKHRVSQNNGDQFIQFLVNLKIQQALAKNEGNDHDADDIEAWFSSFLNILRRLFKDGTLKLEFNYRDYSFEIFTNGTHFPFTGLSAGYAAAMDIVADLMLRMQTLNRLTRVFDMHGIALIDEVETHLHLALQQDIMPFLTTVFPKVQFIVSTHSPFVLNSIPNATIYDLKNKQCVQNLTEYSYEALAEGYFGVETDSGELKMRLDHLEELLSKQSWTDSDKLLIRDLIDDFEKIPDGIAPAQKTRFYEMKRQYLLAGGKL